MIPIRNTPSMYASMPFSAEAVEYDDRRHEAAINSANGNLSITDINAPLGLLHCAQTQIIG
jgi:hypothetical protein